MAPNTQKLDIQPHTTKPQKTVNTIRSKCAQVDKELISLINFIQERSQEGGSLETNESIDEMLAKVDSQ